MIVLLYGEPVHEPSRDRIVSVQWVGARSLSTLGEDSDALRFEDETERDWLRPVIV